MSIKVGVYLFALCFFAVACKPETTGKKAISSIPMESVDAETSGKRAGETHFSISNEEIFLDYEVFDDKDRAATKLEEAHVKVQRILDLGDLPDSEGKKRGAFTIAEFDSTHSNNRYCLMWTNQNRFTRVCSESTRAIEEFRNTYEL